MKPIRLLLLFLCYCPLAVYAQTAEVGGAVQDPSGAVIPKASVEFRNQDTGVRRQTATNNNGYYHIEGIDPGKYDATVQAKGFKTLTRENVVFQVGDKAQIDFKMQVGEASQNVTVDGSGQQINTTDASVGTVVNQQFVANMPLNGRSFQSLIQLSPGVLTTSPQNGTTLGETGEFSVNGQRTDANNYSIDGLSANNGVQPAFGAAGNAGTLASFSALGTTQALVSIDALQEFRITTSTYSAEYGRQPGAQIEFQTKSGTNQLHGTAFDYFRNDALDANNWFNDHNSPIIRKPAERQNDFGGVIGGPILIPKVYPGKDKAFYFLSYEGLRLTQPQPASILYVPSNGTNNTATYSNPEYENLRANAPAALQPLLNAFPLPNCNVQENSQCIDYGDGLSPFILSTSLPSRLNAISGRFDYQLNTRIHLFARYSDTTSSADTAVTTFITGTSYRTRAVSFGADHTISTHVSNQFRLGYSPTRGISSQTLTNLGGAVPVNLASLQSLPNSSGITTMLISFSHGDSSRIAPLRTGIPQNQWNVTDTASGTHGRSQIRFGGDYRRTTSFINSPGLGAYPNITYGYLNAASILQNTATLAIVKVAAEQDPAFANFSAFVQDEWRVRSRLSLSMGARWELNPPPTVVGATQQRTISGSISDPASLSLAPVGTSLYQTTYYNFAPRLGMALVLHDQPGHETVLRGGGGVYFDTGQAFGIYGGGSSPSLGAQATYIGTSSAPVSFPLPLAKINITPSTTPPHGIMYVVSRSLQLPYTFQWNVSLEQALGSSQSLTIGYIGSNGRRLLSLQSYSLAKLNPSFTTLYRYQNGLSSSYNSLQVTYKRTVVRGLQALGSYTWSHALDSESLDSGVEPYQRGNSDNDVRSNFTAAVSYDIPAAYRQSLARELLGGWGTDLRFTARTAFPVEAYGPLQTDPLGNQYYTQLNYAGGSPYVNKTGIPGGRQYNPSLFSVPGAGTNGNSPRNFLRGFGEDEVNLALRREFPLVEDLHLQFRTEAFNLLNHPNFGAISSTCGTSTAGAVCTNTLFGQATGTLASALGGGLTQLYQQGGTRSLQIALKLIF